MQHTASSPSRRLLGGCVAGLVVGGLLSAGPFDPVPAEDDAAVANGHADALTEILDSLGGGHFYLKGRYRFEYVDQDGFENEALASTLRAVLGYESAPWNGFVGRLEFDNVSVLGNDYYNSTVNGKTHLPVVADPETTAVNLVSLDYVGFEDTTLRLGRQALNLDNQRFVGAVGWRQNDQTFDAFSVSTAVGEELDLFYGYVHNVNRIFGDDSSMGDARMGSHLLNASHDLGEWGAVTGYFYMLDYESAETMNTSTVGARWSANREAFDGIKFSWTVEAAKQSDSGDNPDDIDAAYFHGELGAIFPDAPADLGAKIGFELLGGNEDETTDRFTTPLATGHKFQGWADKFLSTPAAGIEDVYVGVSGSLAEARWTVAFHTFSAEDGSMDWGTELDASLVYKCSKRVTVGLKAAAYAADDWATDTDKVWLWVGVNP